MATHSSILVFSLWTEESGGYSPLGSQGVIHNLATEQQQLISDQIIQSKLWFFPVVMYRCESWTIKKAKCQRIDAFELWYWKRLQRVSWTARRSNQSILKEINSEYSLEGLKLKLQYVGQLMRRAESLEKTLMLGWIGGRRRRSTSRLYIVTLLI